MAGMTDSPVRDKNYNLITALQLSLHNAWMLEQYVKDAESHGDDELAEWLHRIQDNNVKAGEQGKRMLLKRLQYEHG